jgi:hypothetical protein
MEFLEREGDGADAKYFNTPATALYLDRNSPRYIGGIPEMLNGRPNKEETRRPQAWSPYQASASRVPGPRRFAPSCFPAFLILFISASLRFVSVKLSIVLS